MNQAPEIAEAFDGLKDGVVVFDRELRCVAVNAAAEQIYASRRGQLIGRTLQEAAPPLEGTDWPASLRACSEWREAQRLRLRHVPLDRWFDVELRPLPGGGVAIELREARTPPAHEAALHERLQRLEEAERRRNDMLAGLAHELRNPLAPLRTSVELLGRPGSDEAARERIREIMGRQVDQLVRLVDELSDMARAGRAADGQGQLPLTPPPYGRVRPVRRVLVADDNELVRESFSELLSAEGYEVRTAVDGEQAVAVADDWQPDAVLLDIHMPRLSGLETARRLRASHPPQAMTLLMMSGMTLNEAWIRHAKAAGFDDCVDKTADPQSWLSRLRGGAAAS
jgi:CheY-like chemotaxis protein/PAS domain-containing protein